MGRRFPNGGGLVARRRDTVNNLLCRPEKAAYLFIAPSMLILTLFVVVPLVAALVISMTQLNLFFTKTNFIGFANYLKAFSTDRVWNSFKNTFYFVLLEVPAQVVLGLVVASALAANTRFNRVMRSIFFIPVVCSLTSISLIWSLILDPTIGMIPYSLTLLGLPKITFLKDPALAMPVLAFLTVWKNFGHTMIIIGAGLTGISSTYYEAARIDGANAFQQFMRVTVPLLLPAIGFCVVTNLIGSMQMFDQAYVTTRGGPLFKTETAVIYIYQRAFSQPFELGLASAISVMLFVVIAVLSLTANGIIRRRERNLY
jgi:multiple sugar transport system permease protein